MPLLRSEVFVSANQTLRQRCREQVIWPKIGAEGRAARFPEPLGNDPEDQ